MEQKIRKPYIDNLRAMIIIIVVMVHTVVTYTGLGSWYYVENKVLDIGSTIFFSSFQCLAQTFDMSFLFMLAGYFIPFSFDAKGPSKFIKDRLFRLGIPLIIYILIIHPIAVKLVYPQVNILDYFIDGIKSMSIFGWTGPLWFVLTLLIFTIIYTILRIILRTTVPFIKLKINIINISLLTLIITIPAFLIRIVMPLGSAIMNLQFPFFSGYIVMFTIGVISRRLELFDHINYKTSKKWLIIAFTLGYIFLLLLMLFGGPAKGEFKIFGGFTWQSFLYSLWESFCCVTISIGLIGVFRTYFNKQNKLQKFLSDNYFAVYVFHAPVLIAISISLKWLIIHPFLKFILVTPLAIAINFLLSSIVRKISFMKKIFS